MGPPIPHDRSRPPERDPETIKAITQRWGREAVDQLYVHLPNGTRWTRFASLGRLAWVYADTPTSGSTLFAREGSKFLAFPMARFSGASPQAFAAVLADAQLDVITERDDALQSFQAVTGGVPLRTQADADALLQSPYGAGNGADPNAVAQFEPPHFRGRTLAFVATFHFAARLVRVLIDADSFAVHIEELGRSQRHMMPAG